jgi:hypothetical protein
MAEHLGNFCNIVSTASLLLQGDWLAKLLWGEIGSVDLFGLNDTITLAPEHTALIDRLLLGKNGRIGKQSAHCDRLGNLIPGEGSHRYYGDGHMNSVLLEKIIPDGAIERAYYTCYSRAYVGSWYREKAAVCILKDSLRTDNQSIRTFNVITVQNDTMLVPCMCNYMDPHINPTDPRNKIQIQIAEYIYNRFRSGNRNNCMALLSGQIGIGKTYIAMILAKMIERVMKKSVILITDFNPCMMGASIHKLALMHCNDDQIFICVINEFDVSTRAAVLASAESDKKAEHVLNKSAFNGMMDGMARTKNFIGFFTSQQSIQDIAVESDPAFVREGRINLSVDMTRNGYRMRSMNPWVSAMCTIVYLTIININEYCSMCRGMDDAVQATNMIREIKINATSIRTKLSHIIDTVMCDVDNLDSVDCTVRDFTRTVNESGDIHEIVRLCDQSLDQMLDEYRGFIERMGEKFDRVIEEFDEVNDMNGVNDMVEPY